jgi:hypothetical protein
MPVLTPDVRLRKGRITFWTAFCTFTYVTYALGNIASLALIAAVPTFVERAYEEVQVRLEEAQVSSPSFGNTWNSGKYFPRSTGHSLEDVKTKIIEDLKTEIYGRVGIIAIVILVITGIPYLLCYCFYMVRLWDEIPGEFARTTPGNAAGFSFIPIFNLYWWFVTFVGLHHDMNKAAESYGIRDRFGTTLIRAACVFWILGFVVSRGVGSVPALAENQGLLGFLIVLLAFVETVFTIPIYWITRNNVLKFIDIKSSMGK